MTNFEKWKSKLTIDDVCLSSESSARTCNAIISCLDCPLRDKCRDHKTGGLTLVEWFKMDNMDDDEMQYDNIQYSSDPPVDNLRLRLWLKKNMVDD